MSTFDDLSGSPVWSPTITTPAIGSPITAQSIADGRQDLLNNDFYLKDYSDGIESRVDHIEKNYTPGSEFITLKSPLNDSIDSVSGDLYLTLELVENNAPDIFELTNPFWLSIKQRGVYQVDFGGYTTVTASSGYVQHSVYLSSSIVSSDPNYWEGTMSAGASIDAGIPSSSKRLWMSASTIKRVAGAGAVGSSRLYLKPLSYGTPAPVIANFVIHVRKVGEY